jgi:hypothetical protein
MTMQAVADLIEKVKEDFQREEDQGLLQRDLHKAEQALAGKYACDRILRAIEAREGIRLMNPAPRGRAR